MTEISSSSRLDALLSYLRLDPGNRVLLKDALQESLRSERWEAARELANAGAAGAPFDADILELVGAIRLHEGRIDEALKCLLRARELGTYSARNSYNIAVAHFMHGDHAAALREMDGRNPEGSVPTVYLLRARCHHHLDEIDLAMASCIEQLAVTPNDAETSGLLALLMQRCGRHEEARDTAAAVLVREPQQLEAQLAIASIHSEFGELEQARLEFSDLLETHSTCGLGWLGLSLVEIRAGHVGAALASVENATRYLREHVGTWHVLGWIHILRGDGAAAELAFESARLIDRNFAETHGGLAVAAALQGREIEAGELARRALRLNPMCASAQYAKFLILRATGRMAESESLIDEFLARPIGSDNLQMRDIVARRLAIDRRLPSPEIGRIH
jgi:tetratricopeptide (TPR) repeat protein